MEKDSHHYDGGSKHWEISSAIERVGRRDEDNAAVVVIGDGIYEEFNEKGDCDYFLVNTDEFQQFAPKGSVVEVLTMDDRLIKEQHVYLVAGNKRLELRKGADVQGAQILGMVLKVRCWPGQKVVDWCN